MSGTTLVKKPCKICGGKGRVPSKMTGVESEKCFKCNGRGFVNEPAEAVTDGAGNVTPGASTGPILPGSRWQKVLNEDGGIAGENIFVRVIDFESVGLVEFFYESLGSRVGRNKWLEEQFRGMFVPV